MSKLRGMLPASKPLRGESPSAAYSFPKTNLDEIGKKAKDTFSDASGSVREVRDIVLHKTLDSKRASLISFWSGVSSIAFGFPTNVLAIVTGHLVEDRRRIADSGAFKVAAKALVPTSEDVKRSRIGMASGYASLIVGLASLVAVIASKRKLNS